MRYRVHSSSLSANLAGMHRAAQAMIHRHFGADDGQPHRWPADKRRAYGGLYRYQALTAVLRQNDWTVCAQFLALALHVDPTLSIDRDLFYDLSMGRQPLGYRGTAARLDLPGNASELIKMLSQVFQSKPASGHLRRTTHGTAFFALGLLAYNTQQLAWCRRFLVNALLNRPDLFRDPLVVGDLLKSFAGRSVIATARRLRGSDSA